jgi:NAD(P)-dependent dehydrogenase (short-subunit alcohol dehydrogenase family)
VNNAGIVETVPFLKSDAGVFDRMIAVHLTAPVVATQAVLPAMLERGNGHVVNVASIAGLAGTAYVAAYVSAKHAMVGLTRALAAEFGHKGVRVNAVCPGYTDTDLVGDSVGKIIAKTGRSREEAMAMILKDAGQKRLVTVDEVADAVLAFVTPGATANGAAVPLMGDDA